jgi:hypothetical protein
MSNPLSDDLGSAFTTNIPPSRNKRTYDLTTVWTKDSSKDGLNPHGPMPASPKAEHYREKDENHWRIEAIYGRQDDGPRTRK